MDHMNPSTFYLNEEHWRKKEYLESREVNRRFVNEQINLKFEDTLIQMYEEQRHTPYPMLLRNTKRKKLMEELFPKDLMEFVEHGESVTGIDIVSTLLGTLGSINSAMCGRYDVQVDDEWSETGSIYSIICADPGTRKSTAVKMLRKPHDKYFSELAKEFEERSIAYEEDKQTLAKLKHKLTDITVRSHLKAHIENGIYVGNPSDVLFKLQASIRDINKHLKATKPKFSVTPQIFLGTASKVSAAAQMSSQGEFGSVLEAEGIFFESEIANKNSNPDLYTKSYDRESYYYSSRNAGNITMNRPCSSITAFIQPDVALKWYRNTNLKGRGLVQRFLILFASKPTGMPQNRSLPTHPNAGTLITYDVKITKMLKRNYTQDKNREIWSVSMTPEAYELIKKYELEIQPYTTRMQFLHMSAFLSKAHGAAVRLALCIHAWNNPEPEKYPITLDEVKAAISLMNIIIEHADRAFNPELDEAYRDANEIYNWIRRCDWTPRPIFTDQDARNSISGLNKKQCHAALDLLEQHYYIRQYFEAGRDRICVLNPQLVEQNYTQRNRLTGRY